MAGPALSSGPDSPRVAELDRALDKIGVTRSHHTIIFLILIGCLFDSFEQNAVGIVGPMLRAQWGLSASDIGLLNTVTFTCAAIGRIISGFIADRYGRRVMLSIDLLLFTLGAGVCAMAPNFAVMALGRAIVGFGLGGEIAIAVTMLAEFCSTRFRGTAVGLVNVGAGGLGNFLAPGFGLLVFWMFPGDNAWRWLFACLMVPALLGAFYRRYIPETPRFLLSQGRVKETNAVLSRLASGRLSAKKVPQQQYIDESGADAQPAKTKVRVTEIFRGALARRTVPLCITIWMTYGAQISVLTLMPTILVTLGYSMSKSLLFTMVMQGGSLLGAIAASLLGFHFPRKRVLTAGAVCACLAALTIGFVAKSIVVILIAGAVFQFFVLLLNTTIWIFAPELYPTRVRAFGTAFILATGTAAGALMPLVAGRLFDAFGLVGVFGLAAGMYAVFVISVQSVPETYGQSPDALPLPGEGPVAGTPPAAKMAQPG
ncbi:MULTISPECIES: MFS transporter [unclassified Variovorax]|uniref:MFS transporter n=1 Tax=unclassified Variovorax TaxID=663243 RepID=UPI0008C537F4|nr:MULTISPECIES: MFS transporter [unclassified Variovorax]SEK14949.1 MFS transporter, putative metabolite:H+ symporter [Variovorax sp. OK202]SFE06843.1 MFS transporter, putative metabolite:H+ symporter [Variovorax sp. OK212]